MEYSSPAIQLLAAIHVPHQIFTHKNPPTSLEQAAQERGQNPEQVIRSIVFRLQAGIYAMVLIGGSKHIAWKKIRAHLGISRISLAKESEVVAVTGYEIGTVNPLALPHPIRILADESVLVPDQISLGSGIRGTAIIINPHDLQNILNKMEVGDFS